MERNLEYVPFFGRWDDLYTFVGTSLEAGAFEIMRKQLALDISCKTPSLLGKWLKSENASSQETKYLGALTRNYFHMTSKQYRKTLSILREKIRVVERLMSQKRWDEIAFDKIPSKAGFKYRNAFARNDVLKEAYAAFAKDTTKTVNADTLYPCEVVHKAISAYQDLWCSRFNTTDVNRDMLNKYWDNLKDYFHNAVFNGVAVVDTSASMLGLYDTHSNQAINPMDVAISLGMYCAEKCNPASPWYGHYISFSRNARLVRVEGSDFVDKVNRIAETNLCENTNIESVFNLILSTAIDNHVQQADMPQNIVIISDMQFDYATYGHVDINVMDRCEAKYRAAGYPLPHLIFWNVDARLDTIPMRDKGGITFISGYSPVVFEMLMQGKSGQDLMLDKLNSERYEVIK